MKKLWLGVGMLLTLVMILSGCARYDEIPSGTRLSVTTPILEQKPVEIPVPPKQDQIGAVEYHVGSGDVLAINVPGISEPRLATDGQKGLQGYRVYSSGKVLLPIVGGVTVAGLTVDEVQLKLQDVFRPYIKDPVVSVEILEFKSQPVYLLGSFNQAGVQYLDRPVSLIQGIALGGGLAPSANLRGARLVREDRVLPVDIYELMYRNDLRHNVPLRPNDTVFVPNNEDANVFVIGAVGSEGRVPMINGRLSLIQALSSAGLGSKSNFDHRNVRIVRSFSATKGELLVVDLEQVLSGQTLPLPLQDGDIVFVPNSPIADWNEALSLMLPSLQAIGAILQPIVQVEYLTD